MSESLTPTEGARFLFERDREEEGGARAVYRTAIFVPNATYEGTAILIDDGTATLSAQQLRVPAGRGASAATSGAGPATAAGAPTSDDTGATKAPEDLVETLQMLAKLTARSASKKREDGLPPWPARILRWRGPGRGS